MRKFLIILFIILIANWVSSALAKDFSKFKARVKVSISAEKNIKGMITSYINRELRSLTDVEIVEQNPEWELNIVAMEVHTKSGYKVGVVFSIVILYKFYNESLLTYVYDSYKKNVYKMTSNLYYYPDHWLRTGAIDDLKNICIGIVADFDAYHLELARKIYKQMIKNKVLQKSKF